MATSFILTDGTTEIELVYNASTQTAYKLQYGAAVNSGGVNPRWFESDDAPPVLTDLTDSNRQAFLTLQVEGADRDTVLNNIATIKRWVDGADQQAARYWLENKTTPRIDLKVQLNGTTNATLHPVIYGEVDDSASHYLAAADLNDKALEVTIMLMLAPYGEAETDVTLRNDLPVSTDMGIDTDSDGTPDGMTTSGTGIGSGITADYGYLTAGQSYSLSTGTGGAIWSISSTVTGSIGQEYVAFADIAITGDYTVTLRSKNGSGTVLDSVTIDKSDPTASSGYRNTFIGRDSSNNEIEFYRVEISGTITGAANIYIEIGQPSGSGAFQVIIDKWYLSVGDSSFTSPSAWVSTSSIYNRNDQSATNPEYINYVDVWGIPGDAPAALTLSYDMDSITGTGTQKYTIVGKQQEPYIFKTHVVEGEDATFTAIGSISGGNTSDATRHAGAYKRMTGAASPGVAQLEWTFSGADADRFLSNVWQCYAVIRSSSTSATFELVAPTGSPVDVNPVGAITVNVANTWECHHMGEVNGRGYSNKKAIDLSSDSVGLIGYVGDTSALPNAQTFDIDFLIFFPVGSDEQTILLYSSQIYSPTYNTGDKLIIDGEYECAFVDNGPWLFAERLGGLWDLSPSVDNRLVTSYFNSSSLAWNLSDNWTLSVTYLARTRHLLGTL